MKHAGYRKLVIDRQIAMIHMCHNDLDCRDQSYSVRFVAVLRP